MDVVARWRVWVGERWLGHDAWNQVPVAHGPAEVELILFQLLSPADALGPLAPLSPPPHTRGGARAEGQLLGEQVEAVKKVSEYVAQLRRVGKGLGVYQFDQALLEEVGKA